MTYRAKLDGLKAIAVFSLIICYAKLNFLDNDFLIGGYLGVDILII
jgi:hypothetical protein